LKAALKWAVKLDARAAVLLGSSELAAGAAQVRDLAAGSQESIAFGDVAQVLAGRLVGPGPILGERR